MGQELRRRAVFLDVDGTLIDRQGRLPDSARDAVREARSRGHLMFLCTGRSLSAMWAEIMSVGWDGIVGAAGAYVEVGGEVLEHRNIRVDQVAEIVEHFQRHGLDFMLESNEGVYASPGAPGLVSAHLLAAATDADMRAEMLRGMASFHKRIDTSGDLVRSDINKVIFLGNALSLDQIRDRFGADFDLVPSSIEGFGGEMSMAGVHKASGIRTVLTHLGIPREDSVAFGDSFNDLEMIEYAGVGVAMGSAAPAIREIADRVTGSPEEDGIRAGFRDLGLI